MATIGSRVAKRRGARNSSLTNTSIRKFMEHELGESQVNDFRTSPVTPADSLTQRDHPVARLPQAPRPAVWPDMFLPFDSPYTVRVDTKDYVECSLLCSKCSKISTWLQQNQPPLQYPYPSRKLSKQNGYARSSDFSLAKPLSSFHHYESGKALEQSYLEGCHLCTIIWHSIVQSEISGPEEVLRRDLETRLSAARMGTNYEISLHWYGDNDIRLTLVTKWIFPVLKGAMFRSSSDRGFIARRIPLITLPSFFPEAYSTIFSTEESWKSRPLSTFSRRTLDLAKSWIHQCDTAHETCRKSFEGKCKYPTRLIHLGTDRKQCKPRLVTTKDEAISGAYLTLSYCWGSFKNATTLTSANIVMFHEQITLENLPKTIQDAMYVTQQLGFDWLWVDSLCIIQDDNLDWQREAASMADVYSNCFLTIAALGGMNSNSGLFCQRDCLLRSKCKLFEDRNGATVFAEYRGFLNDIEGYFQEAPLHQRGWVMQERLLSPRTLNFGVTMIWECRTIFWDEFNRCSEDDYYAHESFKRDFSTPLVKTSMDIEKPLANPDAYSFYEFWKQLVRFYTRANLTVMSDRKTAVTGAITSIERNTGWRNVVGLWEPFLLNELLWATFEVLELDKEPRPADLPSWSWFSTSSEVLHYALRQEVRYLSSAAIAEASNTPRTLRTTPDHVLRHILKLKCHLMPVLNLPVFMNVDRISGDRPEYRFLTRYKLDSLVKKEHTYLKSLYFALILEDMYSFHGLMLRKSKLSRGAYERIGMAEIRRHTRTYKPPRENITLKMRALMKEFKQETIMVV